MFLISSGRLFHIVAPLYLRENLASFSDSSDIVWMEPKLSLTSIVPKNGRNSVFLATLSAKSVILQFMLLTNHGTETFHLLVKVANESAIYGQKH